MYLKSQFRALRTPQQREASKAKHKMMVPQAGTPTSTPGAGLSKAPLQWTPQLKVGNPPMRKWWNLGITPHQTRNPKTGKCDCIFFQLFITWNTCKLNNIILSHSHSFPFFFLSSLYSFPYLLHSHKMQGGRL